MAKHEAIIFEPDQGRQKREEKTPKKVFKIIEGGKEKEEEKEEAERAVYSAIVELTKEDKFVDSSIIPIAQKALKIDPETQLIPPMKTLEMAIGIAETPGESPIKDVLVGMIKKEMSQEQINAVEEYFSDEEIYSKLKKVVQGFFQNT